MIDCATPAHDTTRPVLPMRPRSADWISAQGVADVCGVAVATVHLWRANGDLDGVVRMQRFGAFTYYWRPDVVALRDRLSAPPEGNENPATS